MGAMCGTISSIGVEEIVIVEEHTSKTSVDAKIIKILKTKKERMEGKPPPYAHFNRVILKFHQVEQAFGTLRSTYEHFKDSATDGIRYEDLKAALIYMEVNVEDNDVKEIFDESDVPRQMTRQDLPESGHFITDLPGYFIYSSDKQEIKNVCHNIKEKSKE